MNYAITAILSFLVGAASVWIYKGKIIAELGVAKQKAEADIKALTASLKAKL